MKPRETLPNLSNETIDFRQILKVLSQKKKLLFLIGLLSCCLGVSYALLKPVKYKASVLLEIRHKQDNSFGTITGNNEVSIDEPISLQIALIRSKFVLEPLIQRLNLDVDNSLANSFVSPHTAILNQILSHLTIVSLNPTEGTTKDVGLLQLSIVDTDAKKAIEIANSIAQIAQEKDKERKSREAQQKLIFLNEQLPLVQSSLKIAEQQLNEHRAASGRIDIKLQSQSLLAHLSDIDKQLEIIRLKKMDMAELYTEYHPFLIALSQKQKELENLQAILLKRIQKLPASDQVAANLNREVEIKNNLYTALLNKIHEQAVISAGVISDIRILSPATLAEKNTTPHLLLVGLGSAILGTLLGSIMLFMKEILNRRIKRFHLNQYDFNMGSLIIVPYSKFQARYSRLLKARKTKKIPLLNLSKENDLFMESLSFIKTKLDQNILKTGSNIISILGITNHIGKTYITANLAQFLALNNHDVLLVDIDFRESHLENYFSFQETGLAEILKNNASVQTNISKKIQNQIIDILSKGKDTLTALDLMKNTNFNNLIADLSKQYHYIIINSISGFSLAEATLLGKLSTTNLIVMGENKHESWEINNAIKSFNDAGVNIFCGIFNCLYPHDVNLKLNYKFVST